MQLCKELALHGATRLDYENRGKLLVEGGLFKVSLVESGTSMLNSNVNFVALATKLLSTVPSSEQITICQLCDKKQVLLSPTIILNNFTMNNNLKNINDSLNEYVNEKDKWCNNCEKKSQKSRRELKTHLIIETDSLTNHEKFSVNDIPSQLSVGNER